MPKNAAEEDRLRELAPQLRRYRGRANSVFAAPGILQEVCRLFGFRNQCTQGHVFLTDSKVYLLEQLGLPAMLDEDWPADAGVQNDGALGATNLKPPLEDLVGVDQMTPDQRRFAAYLAGKHGYRINRRDWHYHAARRAVVVIVPGAAVVWSVQRDLDPEIWRQTLERHGLVDVAEREAA